MPNQQLCTVLPTKILVEEFEKIEPCWEFTEEVKENVVGFVMLVTLCKVTLLLVLTTALVIIFPPLAVVGLSLIAFLLNHSLKNIRELERAPDA